MTAHQYTDIITMQLASIRALQTDFIKFMQPYEINLANAPSYKRILENLEICKLHAIAIHETVKEMHAPKVKRGPIAICKKAYKSIKRKAEVKKAIRARKR